MGDGDERMLHPDGIAPLTEAPEYYFRPAPKSNDHKRTQPFKIKHLLEEFERSAEKQKKSAQKNNERPKLLPERLGKSSEIRSEKKSEKQSERPRLQPERLGQYSEVKSAKKSEKRSALPRSQPKRLGPLSVTKSAKTSGKQIGSVASVQSTESSKCARRFLNFNGIFARTPKGKENKLPAEESAGKKPVYKPQKKRSLLLPPNSIKQKHLQKTQNNVTRCSRVSEISREMDDTNLTHDSISAKESQIVTECPKIATHPPTISDNKEPRDKREIDAPSNRTSSRIPSTNHGTRQASIPRGEPRFVTLSQSKSLPEISATREDRLLSKDTPKSVQGNAKSIPCLKSKETDRGAQNLCGTSRPTEAATAERDPSAIEPTKGDESDPKLYESQMIYVNRDQIIRLEGDLKNLLRETEENAMKLRSTLTYVTTLLSINDRNGGIALSSTGELSKEIKQADKEVQVDACSRSLVSQYSEDQLNTPITRVSQIAGIDKDFLSKAKLTQMDEENNKENVENLNANRISDVTSDGSFLELENKLNIEHANPVRNWQTQPRTPRIAKYKQKRSLREYMALKSSISFLETPDSRRFRSLCQLNTNDKPSLNASYISSKLLTDLDKLYSESPDIGS